MDYADKILKTFTAKEDSIILFWESASGWNVLKSGDPFIDKACYETDGIFGLEGLVTDKDLPGFVNFTDLIRSAMGEGDSVLSIQKPVIEGAFSLNSEGDSRYYKIVAYLSSATGKCENILFRMELLDPEESYRYRLARIITNDKNPESFNTEVEKLFKQNPDKEYALVQFDIAGFKVINQQYGELFADEILNFFVNSLKFLCDDTQLYVRLTADVFMVLTPYENNQQIIDFIEKIRSVLLGYKGTNYRLVFGVNRVFEKTSNLRKYGDGAALARQSIKNNALVYYAFYDESMNRHASNRKWLEDNMENSLKNGEFKMYLQPKYSISKNTRVGAEALVRWVHPERGMVYPLDFIPYFEENGFITKLDRFMWEEACKCISNWRDTGREMLPISVNVSRKNLENDSYIEYLEDLISRYDIPKELLEVEITETFDDVSVMRGVQLFKQHGFTLLMDDFGTGYSSLNMLKDTQFDVIKIDREFLRDFINSERGKQIVKHTISMSQDMGIDIVAEGVEELEQAKFLESCGCDVAQGYYYDKPMTVEEFNATFECDIVF